MQSATVESHPAHREDRANPDGTKDAQDQAICAQGNASPSARGSTVPSHGLTIARYASSREMDLVRTAMRTDEGILLPALGTPDSVFTQPTWTFESIAQISTAPTLADRR
jgi:hypothetical protein